MRLKHNIQGGKCHEYYVFLSYFILWIIVLILSGMVFYLYKRIEGSKTARKTLAESNSGIPKGEIYPIVKFNDISGRDLLINPSKKATILLFTSAHCDVCKKVYPLIEAVNKRYSQLNLVLLMLATNEEAERIIDEFNINNVGISLMKEEDLQKNGVPGFPFCYLLAPNGEIRSKGIVNNLEHFDILISNYIKVKNVS
jgi:methylamine dehydrogenase accessory protein MauD